MELSVLEFKALLLIHASFIDYEFHPKEREYLINIYGVEIFDKMMITYLTGREDSFNYLKNNFDAYFPKESEKSNFKDELFGLMIADNNYSQIEKAFMDMFRTKLKVS